MEDINVFLECVLEIRPKANEYLFCAYSVDGKIYSGSFKHIKGLLKHAVLCKRIYLACRPRFFIKIEPFLYQCACADSGD